MTKESEMAGKAKNDRIYVRVNDEIKQDFERVAAYRGLRISSLLHSLIVRTIHEMREAKPEIFADQGVPEALEFETEVEEKAKASDLRETAPEAFGEMKLCFECD